MPVKWGNRHHLRQLLDSYPRGKKPTLICLFWYEYVNRRCFFSQKMRTELCVDQLSEIVLVLKKIGFPLRGRLIIFTDANESCLNWNPFCSKMKLTGCFSILSDADTIEKKKIMYPSPLCPRLQMQ